ncbi:MAG: hypothetical protein J7M20_03815 [Deltaproteobacteria bacterium]|nr:hypothetical protein [Deltaproteobacteria bacterium]
MFENLPLVIQFSKRNLKDIISERAVLERWKPTGFPIAFSSALYGKGVREPFEEILKQTFLRLDALNGLKTNYSITEESFLMLSQS